AEHQRPDRRRHARRVEAARGCLEHHGWQHRVPCGPGSPPRPDRHRSRRPAQRGRGRVARCRPRV
ncbi:MAG: hypothetical protein AVDCRST_MAG76-804, partial [uncultured Acidimicrobiales bacterium]